jgi:predicted GH43/DUF377 family glycosyl hydrolase
MIQHTIIPTYHDNGYNPSIIRADTGVLMSYRYHPNRNKWRTVMMIVEEREGCNRELPLILDGIYADMSHEDGRLFYFNGKLHISLTVSVFPGTTNTAIPCAMVYGELERLNTHWSMKKIFMPKFGLNEFVGQEKNWLFFEHNNRLYFIYQCSPTQTVCQLSSDGVTVDNTYRTTSPSWSHGELRGGTQPLAYKGKWLRFFHSLHRHGNNRADWTYCIGALVMNPEPPFAITQISRFPVFTGDERFVPNWRYWKPSVAIVYGAIAEDDGWKLSIGINDSYCGILNVKEKDLNL